MKKTFFKVFIFCFFILINGYLVEAAGEKSSWRCFIKTRFLMEMGKVSEAGDLIDKHLEKFSSDYAIIAEQAVVRRLNGGGFSEVKELLEKSRKTEPSYFRSTFLLASATYDEYLGNPSRVDLLNSASELTDLLLKQNPGFFEGTVLAGIIALDKGDYGKALGFLEEAATMNRSSYLVHYKTAACYNKIGNQEKELVALKKALDIKPDSLDLLGRASDILVKAGRYKESVGFLQKIHQQIPSDKEITYRYLYSLFLSGEMERFLKEAELLDISSSTPLVYAKSIALVGMKRFDEAELLLDKVGFRNQKYYLIKADIALGRYRYYDAFKVLNSIGEKYRTGSFNAMYIESMLGLTLYQRVISFYNPLSGESKLKLGVQGLVNILLACSKEGNYKIASEVFEGLSKVIDKSLLSRVKSFKEKFNLVNKSKIPNDLRGLGSIEAEIIVNFLEHDGNYLAAVKLMENRYSFYRDINDGLKLANIYWSLGRPQDSCRLLKKMCKIYPDVPAVLNAYAYMLGKANRKLKRALEFAKKALNKRAGDPSIMDTYGFILLKMGRVSEAERYLEKAIVSLPFDKEIENHLKELYLGTGKKDKFRKFIERRKELLGDF